MAAPPPLLIDFRFNQNWHYLAVTDYAARNSISRRGLRPICDFPRRGRYRLQVNQAGIHQNAKMLRGLFAKLIRGPVLLEAIWGVLISLPARRTPPIQIKN
jgi:hypothetical protein